MKKAFITGITGQDGSYLAELLLEKGYAVHGLVRRASAYNRTRIDHLRTDENLKSGRLVLHYGELNDLTSFHRLLHRIEPEEIYHLAGQSHVGLSFEIPEVTCLENGMATLHLLESLRELDSGTRLFIAASSEIFGAPAEAPQTETTPINPTNPYGCAKAFAHQLASVYRQAHGLFVCNGIAYNHESPRRGENFVTRKISMAAAQFAHGRTAPLELGNLNGTRDWGYAKEYVEGMWSMLQADTADDYILATGRSTSVREFAASAFAAVGLELEFSGEESDEVGKRTDTGEVIIQVSPRYYRPIDAAHLRGDPTKACQKLNWEAKTTAAPLAQLMVEADLQRIRRTP